MAKDPFQYAFRFCCDPGFNDENEVPALLRFIDEANLDDVLVFANVEELNTGHMTASEQDIYLALMRRLQPLLAAKGVTLSINHWHSVMHADLGKTLPPDQPFRRMVDICGHEASLCVCPLDKAWQKHIGRIYARYAEIAPHILWVEDDFRLHNHDPLVWGGCFCAEHMRLYSERAGKAITREEFLAGVLQPGKPHPYRAIWLDIARDTMVSAAQAIADAVRTVSPTVKIGLMSSVPQVHAAEGRDWGLLLGTLAAGQTPIDRIHLPAYQEMAPSAYLQRFNMVSMLNAAMLPKDCEIYPELENYPFSRFSKSRTFTRFQLLSALPIGLKGITIDLFDLNGNGIVFEDRYQDTLRLTKPYLNELTDMGVFTGEREGVRVLYSQRAAYHLHTERGKKMEELYPHETYFAGLLPAMGIPFVFSDDICQRQQVVAVSGQALRNWSTEEIERLFESNILLLSGDAAATLFDMNLGHLAGIENIRRMRQNGGEYTYEQVINGRVYNSRQNARASAVISMIDALDITYQENASVEHYTGLFNSYRQQTAHGCTIFDGRILIIPFGYPEGPTTIPPMAFNDVRQEVIQDMLHHCSTQLITVRNESYLEPYWFSKDGFDWLYLVNGCSDAVETITLSLPILPSDAIVPLWPSCGEKQSAQGIVDGSILRLPFKLPPMETVLLRLPVQCGR